MYASRCMVWSVGMGCAWGSIVSSRNAQASEARLLEHVSKIHGAAYGVLALGMCLWSIGGEGNWVIMLSIVVLSILGESKRRNMARERLGRV